MKRPAHYGESAMTTPAGVIDRTEVLYRRGEAVRVKQEIEERIHDCEREQQQVELAETRAAWAEAIAEIKAYLRQVETAINRFDELLPGYVNFDDAITFMRKAWQKREMRGLTGYINFYSTDSKFAIETMIRAVRSTGSKFSWVSQKDDYYAIQIKLRVDVIELIEADTP